MIPSAERTARRLQLFQMKHIGANTYSITLDTSHDINILIALERNLDQQLST